MSYNTYTWVYVREGQHTFRTKFPIFFGGLNLDGGFKVEAGQNFYLKLNVWNGGGYPVAKIYSTLYPVPEQTATTEAKRCWFRKPQSPQIESLSKETRKGNAETQPNKLPEPKPTVP